MNWLNLEIRDLRSAAYIGSSPTERATWIGLLAYCCEQENGGRVAGAAKWKDRQWQQLCGVTSREVRKATRLLTWDGDDLVVMGYPHAKEEEVKSKREAGRSGGLRSGEARSKQNGSTASSTACQGASTEGEGKEKEKGRRKEPTTSPDGGTSEHALFAKLWTDAYPLHHGGEKYAFQGAKDGAAVKQLLATSRRTPAELMAVAVAAWKTPAGFNSKMAASLSGFNSKFNDIRNELSAIRHGGPSRGIPVADHEMPEIHVYTNEP